jgi:hypothetical protein
VALAKGPLLYCLEGTDHPGVDLRDVRLPSDSALSSGGTEGAFGGAPTLCADGIETKPDTAALYGGTVRYGERKPIALTAVPYFAWANREPGQMQVWIEESKEA